MRQKISVLPSCTMNVVFECSFGTCFFAAFLCLALPLNWLFAAFSAAVWHELCHVGTVLTFGGNIRSLKVGISGAIIDVSGMTSVQEFISVLSGPLGSLFLLLLHDYFPRTAVCAMVQGIFNLLPIYPLDGGRALRCFTAIVFSPILAERICYFFKWLTVGILICIALCGTVGRNMGVTPFFILLLLVSRTTLIKFPCKEGDMGVQ